MTEAVILFISGTLKEANSSIALIRYFQPLPPSLVFPSRESFKGGFMISILDSTANETSGSDVILESTITCPACGYAEIEIMATDACLYFYQCLSCKTLLKPKPGDCCVFCSYGSVKCPPVQMANACSECHGNGKLVIRSM